VKAQVGAEVLKSKVRRRASQLGIDVIGFAAADEFEREREWLEQRASEGRASGFEEEDVDLRCTPRRLLEGAQTLISAAIAYPSLRELAQPRDGRLRGRISSHSWGRDYHKVLADRLDELARYLEAESGEVDRSVRSRVFVDTGPLLDRAVAARAGVGYIGKNTSLITREYGSWVFLGEILTTVWLPPDEPLAGDCGTCELCIKACPTGALVGPYRLDASRCLAQLTQERDLPAINYRKAFGSTLYGCDICQNVCPQNRGVLRYQEADFTPKEAEAYPELLQLFSMSNREFQEAFGHLAGAWRQLSTWQRNALVIIGNRRYEPARGLLQHLLNHRRVVFRGLAAWGLGRIGDKRSLEALHDRLKVETDPEVKAELDEALCACARTSTWKVGETSR